MKLKAYQELVKYKTCGWCGTLIGDQSMDMYDHPDGWKVDGIDNLQWLSLRCPKCGYDWSLWKLGVVDGRGK